MCRVAVSHAAAAAAAAAVVVIDAADPSASVALLRTFRRSRLGHRGRDSVDGSFGGNAVRVEDDVALVVVRDEIVVLALRRRREGVLRVREGGRARRPARVNEQFSFRVRNYGTYIFDDFSYLGLNKAT